MKKILVSSLVTASFIVAINAEFNDLEKLLINKNPQMVETAQEVDLFDPQKIGMIANLGTHFETADSRYLNIILDSAEHVNLSLESVPEMVTIRIIEPAAASSGTLSLGGFLPNTTYYKYEDDYSANTPFTTDENGRYSYIQDISGPHLIFIQPRPSTIFLRDDATGGDCLLKNIGNWDAISKTCTLTSDLAETVQISNNGLTLDGNNHSIIGLNTGNGIYAYAKSGVTIKNLSISNFASGIFLNKSSNNNILNNILEHNVNNIVLDMGSMNNKVSGNSTKFGTYGMSIVNASGNNIIEKNNVESNSSTGLFIYGANNIFTNNTIGSNLYGLLLYRIGSTPSNNQVYNNNFLNNISYQAYNTPAGGNIFNLAAPVGGNYWSNWTSPDTNNDRFVDSPYSFTGASDNLPWTAQNAWLDNIAPETTANVSGILGNNDWYTTDAEITLTAQDNIDGTGVLKIEYSWDGGTVWNEYSAPMVLNTDGVKTLSYRATDKAKNIETTKTLEIKSDKTAPGTDITLSGTLGPSSWYSSNVSVVLNSLDASGGSGIEKIEYSFDNLNWNIYSSVFTVSEEGETTIYYRGFDIAGNSETTKQKTVGIDRLNPLISGAPVQAPNQNGWHSADVTVRFNCADSGSGAITPTFDMAISSEGSGQQVTGQCTDRAGNASSLTVGGINIDKTKPVVSVMRSPEANAKGWNNTSIAVTFAATDSLSGIDGSSTSIANFNLEGASQGTSRTFKDKAGNEAIGEISGVNIDLTDPVLQGAALTDPNSEGWYNSTVSIHFSGGDTLSGINTVSPDVVLSAEGAAQTITGTAEDNAGNHASFTVSGINIDKTAPVITGVSLPPANSKNWNNTDVQIKFTASDNLSGVSTVSPPVNIITEGANQSVPGTATDKAGNTATATIEGINIDKTLPTISAAAKNSPTFGEWYNTDVLINFSASDLLSGIDSVTPDTAMNEDGANQSLEGKAVDKAGNEASVSISGINIDKTNPQISGKALPAANTNGWNNEDVMVHFTCSDTISMIKNCTQDALLSNEDAGQSVSGTALDNAGNSANTVVDNINIDKTAPVTNISIGGNDCSNSSKVISLAAEDILSGVSGTLYSLNNASWVTYTGQLNITNAGNYTLVYKSLDKADNAEIAKTESFTIDKGMPEALIKFDPVSKEIKVYSGKDGVEAGYTVLPGKKDNDSKNDSEEEKNEQDWELRKYSVKDCAENSLAIILKYKKEGKEIKVKVISLQYGNDKVINARENNFLAEYSLEKSGSIKELEQGIVAKKRFDLDGKFSADKNQTVIKLKLEGKKEKKETKAGMVLIEMVTSKGALKYKY